MTAWATIRRVSRGTIVPLFVVLVFPSFGRGADDTSLLTKPNKLSPAQWRTSAEAAEKANDWEGAFTAYCHLFVAERASPEVRERLNYALRRSQQVRRHRDPAFQQFAAGMSTLDAMRLFAEVLTKVPVLYVDRERATPQLLWEHGIEELARALDNPVFRQVYLDNPTPAKIDGFRNSLRSSWARQTVANANDARRFLPKLLDAADAAFTSRLRAALVLEIVCGSCAGLDEYTVFLNPSLSASASVAAEPDLTAQGVYLGYADGGLVVAGIAPGSWAALEIPGLRKGDRITTLNGKSMAGATPAMVAESLRVPAEGVHELEVLAADADAPAFVARLPVAVPTVYGTSVVAPKDAVPGKDGAVGYTRIGQIAATTPRELDEAIHGLKARGVRSLVIDLRGNMGGSFIAGVDTAKRLIPAGLLVTTQGQVARVDNQPFTSDSGMTAHDIPVVVLVDSETASAAEVLAAALKDHRRATLVGMPTFGKGAVQYPVRLDALDEKDGTGQPKTAKSGGVRLTIAKLISPSGAAINGVGVTPHELEMHPGQQLDLAFKKAIELLPASSAVPAMPMVLPTTP